MFVAETVRSSMLQKDSKFEAPALVKVEGATECGGLGLLWELFSTNKKKTAPRTA